MLKYITGMICVYGTINMRTNALLLLTDGCQMQQSECKKSMKKGGCCNQPWIFGFGGF